MINTIFTRSPFTITQGNQKAQLPTGAKVTIIALTIFAGVISCGLLAVPTFFLAARYFRGRHLKPTTPSLIPKPIQENARLFQEKQIPNGKLYYRGDIPIVEISSTQPKRYGEILAELTAPQFAKAFKKLKEDKVIAARINAKTIEAHKKWITPEALEEMEGFRTAYTEWAKNHPEAPQNLSLDDQILLHLIPDALHYKVPGALNDGVGCSVLIDGVQGNLVAGRNLDWASHDVLGMYTLVVVRKTSPSEAYISITCPGFFGETSAIKLKKGNEPLALFMNVCSGNTRSIKGPMAGFNNRAILNACDTVAEAKEYVSQHKPLGPYHCTLMQTSDAATIHFKQMHDESNYIRCKSNDQPLIVTNFRYTPESRTHDVMCSKEREEVLFQTAKSPLSLSKRVRSAISSNRVNNAITIQSFYFNPKKGTLKLSFANSFAGRVKKDKIDLNGFLS